MRQVFPEDFKVGTLFRHPNANKVRECRLELISTNSNLIQMCDVKGIGRPGSPIDPTDPLELEELVFVYNLIGIQVVEDGDLPLPDKEKENE